MFSLRPGRRCAAEKEERIKNKTLSCTPRSTRGLPENRFQRDSERPIASPIGKKQFSRENPPTKSLNRSLSPQNENVRFVQSRNVRFNGWPRSPWKGSARP